jgi:hypothetical protein
MVLSLASYGSDLYAGGWGAIFRSTDNGATWTKGYHDYDTYFYALIGTGANLLAGTTYQWNHGGQTVTEGGVWLSADNGSTLTLVSSGMTHGNVKAFITAGTDVYAAADGPGVYRSTDNGASWTQCNNGLTSIRVQCVSLG